MAFSHTQDTGELLARPVSELRGVGPERSSQLDRLGIRTVGELLLHRPRRYEDRRQARRISELRLQEPAIARGSIVALGIKRYAQGRKSVFELILDDGTGRLHCRWWNQPFMQSFFAPGDELVVFGKPNSLRPRAMDHPETEIIQGGEEASIHLNRIVPIYPLTEGLPQRWLRAVIYRLVEEFAPKMAEPWPELPPGLPELGRALQMLHFPGELGEGEAGRRRLAFDELLLLQRAMQKRRRNLETQARSSPCGGDNRLIKPFLGKLGFRLTEAQLEVLREIRADLRRGTPMRRLLQGDVGSGKTVVAACTALMAIESGFTAALMAPTEILAEQHFRTFQEWLGGFGIAVELCTGNRNTLRERSGSGTPAPAAAGSMVIGTHALIEDSLTFDNLGLVIIDEQHKFGVAQREKLVRKGRYPHLLVMTATPIPRTLGLTLYGDLDISVIRQAPPGRQAIKTFIRGTAQLPRIWNFIREELEKGRQTYIVYPRIEEGNAAGLKAVTAEWERIRQLFAGYEVALLHGKMKAEEKEAAMGAFRQGCAALLVTTSVIEVGLDVPNATVMVIQNAEQYGLAQLHQLRGRIGRGGHQSFCILLMEKRTEETLERLKILEKSTDGFHIAEADLKMRGPGDLLGKEQSGLPPLRFADLFADRDLVEQARDVAREMVREEAEGSK